MNYVDGISCITVSMFQPEIKNNMKRELSDDSPMSDVRAFSAQLIELEQDLRDLAEQLHEDMDNK